MKNLILSSPAFFNLYQFLIGADSDKKKFIYDIVQPFSGAKVLDMGCGTGSLLNYLPLDIEYTGYDVNQDYINHAVKRYGKRGTFYCEKIKNTSQLKSNYYDIALMGGVLHHLNDNDAESLLKLVHYSLKPGGYLATYDGVYTNDQSKLAKFILSKDRGEYVRNFDQYTNLVKKIYDRIETNINNAPLLIPFTSLTMRCFK